MYFLLGKYLCELGVGQDFLNKTSKRNHKAKNMMN